MGLTVIVAGVLLLVSLSSPTSTAPSVYYVKPTPDTKCPGNPCFTLSEYAQNASQYFNSSGTFHFLPGNHTLDRDIPVYKVSSMSFLGEQDNASQLLSWVSCTEPAFFNLTQVQDMKIHALGFRRCGTGTSLPRVFYFTSVHQFAIENSKFEYSQGSSLLFNLSNGTLENVSFLNNTADLYGGAVLAVKSSLIFSGITTFAGNKASLRGGAIYSQDSLIEFQDGVKFENNMATDGSSGSGIGGAATFLYTTVQFRGPTRFAGNKAGMRGGAIYLQTSPMEFQDCAEFENNMATDRFYGSGIGGAISVVNITLQFNGPTSFLNNSAFQGGAIVAFQNAYIHSSKNITFARNSAGAGGAMFLTQNSTVEFTGNSNFTGNTGNLEGAVLSALDSRIVLNGTNIFHDNHNKGFGGLFINSSYLHIEGFTVFTNNSVEQFGGAMFVYFSNVTMSGTAHFAGNTAGIFGGALQIQFSSFHFSGLAHFDRNSAFQQGGAIDVVSGGHLSFTGTTVFTNNSCTSVGGGAVSTYVGVVSFNGTTVFDSNQATAGGGGAIVTTFSTVTIAGYSNFTANSAPKAGGAIYSDRSDILFNGTGDFADNTCDNTGGAMYTRGGSTVSFDGSIHFDRNRASEGGAISTEQDSLLRFMSPVELVFTDNQAEYGGAMFVLNRLNLNYCTKQNLLPVDFCFFEVYGTYSASAQWGIDIHLVFTDNLARVAGSVLYGGMLQGCTIVFANTPTVQQGSAIGYFKNISNITGNVITPRISSDPVRICFCLNDTHYDCDYSLPPFHRSPGQSFNFSVVAVDQGNNPVPATIRTTFSVESSAELGTGEQTQPINPFCSGLQYRVFSSSGSENLTLAAQSQCNKLGTALKSVSLMLLQCPNGFERVRGHCVCAERLQKLAATCDVETLSIEREGNFWVNASYSRNGSYEGLIIYSDCPFEYCQADPVNFTLSDPNAQCAFNRSGFLCGGCDSGLSLTLGGLQCERCSNVYLTLVIAFAVLGLALILMISLCRLTVGIGAINGLIFYANIVYINSSIFFPAGDSNVLTVFIAWVNLDLGINTCFFNGLDSYTWTWLQFVFPLYLWLLAAILILVSKYSPWITRFIGTNPVAVLATLFLLSYAKILRTIIMAFYIAFLEYPDGTKEAVWLFDGNIRYLHGQHIPLFIFSLLVLIILFLPYTLFLLLGQWLQAYTEFRLLSWMDNLSVQHFRNAYYGPFKPRHRYWTGFLLLVRCVLFVVFAFNVLGNASLNLLLTASSMLGITFLARLTNGIYEAWILDLLEASYFLNLGVLAAGTYHVDQAGGNQTVLAYVSVGIAFATFIATAAVQAYKQFKGTSYGKKVPDISTLLPQRCQEVPVDDEVDERDNMPVDAGDVPINAPNGHVTHVSNVRLREPLLES